MEVSKAILYPHGETVVNGKKCYKYVLASVVLTHDKFDVPDGMGEVVLMGNSGGKFSEIVNKLTKYESTCILGEIGVGLIHVSRLDPECPEQLKKIK